MPSFRSPREQARHAVSEKIALGESRHGSKDDGRIHSVRTAQAYQQVLTTFGKFVQEHRLGDLKCATADTARAYLQERQEAGLTQKTIDQDRQALQCHLGVKLERITALEKTELHTRSYTEDQIRAIAAHQSERNALATKIVHFCGLRAHELATLRPSKERGPSSHREWREDRFVGREGERYTVTGKGGLCREVVIPRELAQRLESSRLEKPIQTMDRGVIYEKHYDIGAGKNWSASFSRVSQNVLSWSNGGHGVRHTYVQLRIRELQGELGYGYKEALAVVAQEVGHFDPHTTEEYLR